jgi:hypothetical protein
VQRPQFLFEVEVYIGHAWPEALALQARSAARSSASNDITE